MRKAISTNGHFLREPDDLRLTHEVDHWLTDCCILAMGRLASLRWITISYDLGRSNPVRTEKPTQRDESFRISSAKALISSRRIREGKSMSQGCPDMRQAEGISAVSVAGTVSTR